MSRAGRYDPLGALNSSDLFVYGESPVTAAKLNRWDSNIAASFWLVQSLLRNIAIPEGEARLAALGNPPPLKVEAQEIPDMTVRIQPGLLIGPGWVAGASAAGRIPETGSIAAPSVQARIDAIGINAEGQWVHLAGQEAAAPESPDLPSETVHLADLYLRPGSVSILDADDAVNGYIIDQRPPLLFSRAHQHTAIEQPAETCDGARTAFSTQQRFLAGSLRVYANGLALIPAVHYTEDGDHMGYAFVNPPPAGFVIHHEYQPA